MILRCRRVVRRKSFGRLIGNWRRSCRMWLGVISF